MLHYHNDSSQSKSKNSCYYTKYYFSQIKKYMARKKIKRLKPNFNLSNRGYINDEVTEKYMHSLRAFHEGKLDPAHKSWEAYYIIRDREGGDKIDIHKQRVKRNKKIFGRYNKFID